LIQYVLNFVINKKLNKKGKLFIFPADLKATCDKIDRRKLEEIIKRIKN